MSLAIERYISPDVPNPAMLRRLACVCVSAASSQNALKSPAQFRGSHYFTGTMDALGVEASEYDGQVVGQEPAEIWERLAGRVGRVRQRDDGIKLRRWSLKIYHAYALRRPASGWLNAQTLYRFEWDEQRTRLAEREHRLIDALGAPVRELSDVVLNFSVPEEMAALWHAETEVARITGPECEDIITQMANYFH